MGCWGLTGIVKYLVTKGADINVKSEDVLTPLQLAFLERQTTIAELLLKTKGA
ncbi:MAG: hypothetical protein ACYC2U_01075 [Candidatus Amoebophilus sp.]